MRMVSPAEAVAEVRARLSGRPGTRWVGVDGFGASGKSGLAARLVGALPGAVPVAVDDFARPGTVTWERDRFAAEVLEPLLAGRAGRYRRWPYDSDAAGEEVEVPPGVPVVVEGVSCTDRRVPVPWDLRLWVAAPPQVRWARILARDPPELLGVWRERWQPLEEAYAAEQRPTDRADLVVDGTGW